MNSLIQEFRSAEHTAERILRLKNNNFLDDSSCRGIQIDQDSFVPNIDRWFALKSLRMKKDTESTESALMNAVTRWIKSSSATGCCSVFAIEKTGKQISLHFGSGRNVFECAFKANLPECEISEMQWDADAVKYPFSGILTGRISAINMSETVATEEKLTGCYVSLVSIPVADTEIKMMIAEDREMAAGLENYKSFQRVYGNATRRIEEIPVRKVIHALSLLREETEFLESGMEEGFYWTAVRFGAAAYEEYSAVKNVLLSTLRASGGCHVSGEPVRCFDIINIGNTKSGCIAVPCVSPGCNIPDKVHMFSLQDTAAVAAFCMPPMNSFQGYVLKNYHIDENSGTAFPISPPYTGDGILLGTAIESGVSVKVPYNEFLRHCAVFGSTASGKTSTVMKILDGMYKKGIPFIVIEAAKKEYYSLLGLIPDLKVYTPGTDGTAILMNPLQPEDGVLIENHIDALVRAICAATDAEQPIPVALQGLFKQTYERFGWKFGMMAYRDPDRQFPVFADVYEDIDSYIENCAAYGPEVRQNLTAALRIRIENMRSGALGRMFACSSGLTAKDFFSTPIVIELSDLSEQSVSFLMNVLLYRFQCYASRLPQSSELKQLIVIEEAHNVYRKTIEEDTPRAINNNAFDKMLAEIRAFGVGLIFSDQRPSVFSDGIMANTAIKIIHSMVSEEDRKIVAGATGMTEFQSTKTSEFQAGECIISVRGHYGVQHIMVDRIKSTRPYTAACLVCKSRPRCSERHRVVEALLAGADPAVINYYIGKIASNPYNLDVLATNIRNFLRTLGVVAKPAVQICFLGEILSISGIVAFQESRIIVHNYSVYIERGQI